MPYSTRRQAQYFSQGRGGDASARGGGDDRGSNYNFVATMNVVHSSIVFVVSSAEIRCQEEKKYFPAPITSINTAVR